MLALRLRQLYIIYRCNSVRTCTIVRAHTSSACLADALAMALAWECDIDIDNSKKLKDPCTSHADSYVQQMCRMQPVPPDSLGLWVSLAGRNSNARVVQPGHA